MGRTIKLLCFSMMFLCLAGCTKKEDITDGIRVSYELWVGITAMLGGVVATVIGWFARTKGWRGWLFFIIAVLGLTCFAPFPFVDHVTVTNQRISTQWGFWPIPTKHDFSLDDVTSVTMTKETSRSRRGGRRTSYYLNFRLNDGTTEKLTAGNKLMEEAADELVSQLAAHGIQITDQTGE